MYTIRPQTNEFHPYFSKYVGLVPAGDIIKILEQQNKDTNSLLKEMSEEQGLFKYSPNKWSIKEVVGHLIDTERILGYVLFCIARGEAKTLPNYDKNSYIRNAQFNKRSMEYLLESLNIVRKSTLHLIKSLHPEDFLRHGFALDSKVTVCALITILAGHELHHRKILQELYINSKDFPIVEN